MEKAWNCSELFQEWPAYQKFQEQLNGSSWRYQKSKNIYCEELQASLVSLKASIKEQHVLTPILR